MNFLGIDPGLDGGIGLITSSGYYDVWEIPTNLYEVKDRKRRQYDRKEMYVSLDRLALQRSVAGIEEVGNRAGLAAQAVKQMGVGEGVWHTLLDVCGIEFEVVRPQDWKDQYGLNGVGKGLKGYAKKKKVKEASVETAYRLFPDARDKIKGKDGLAEALLIAEWRRRMG